MLTWKLSGRGAKVIRNRQLIEAADHAVFFWDGKSNGTTDGIAKAEAKGIIVDGAVRQVNATPS